MKHFYLLGLSYKKAPLYVREDLGLVGSRRETFFTELNRAGIDDVLLLNTCNRVELYFTSTKGKIVMRVLAKVTGNLITLIEKYAYKKQGLEVVRHLFRVGAGLDSQILGDTQIAGQLKQSYQEAADRNMIKTKTSRLVEKVLCTSKTIKNRTSLSEGTSSIGYAVVSF